MNNNNKEKKRLFEYSVMIFSSLYFFSRNVFLMNFVFVANCFLIFLILVIRFHSFKF